MQQLISAVTIAEQNYNAKAAKQDPSLECAATRLRKALLERVETNLGQELNIKEINEHSGSNALEYESEVSKFDVTN